MPAKETPRIRSDWEITVTVPAAATDEERDAIFTDIADAAYDAEPEDRDGWDISVHACAVDAGTF